MAKITFITKSGENIDTEADDGSVMEAAVDYGVEGIDASCGGVCSCATCHVHIAPEWMDRVGPATEAEQELLAFEDTANERSRLSCQIEVSEALDGLTVTVATQ